MDEDDTLKFHPSPSDQCQRFSLEAFQYVSKHPYVFFHCKVKICNATDPNSRCAQGCVSRKRRSTKPLPESVDDTYALAQGPFTLNRKKREAEADEADQSTRVASKGKRQSIDGVYLNEALRSRQRFQLSLEDIQNGFLFLLLSSRLFAPPIQAIK